MKKIYREVLKSYDKDRTRAQKLYDERYEKLCAKIPRIREIDAEIRSEGVRLALEAVRNSNADLKETAARGKKLSAERKRLALEAGFPKDYLETVYKCPKCRDTGYVKNNRCECFKRKIVEELYSASSLKNVLQKENFKTFNIDFYPAGFKTEIFGEQSARENIVNVLNVCKDFVRFFDRYETQNLFFSGHTGTGKTFLCNCIAKELLDAGKMVLYIGAAKLFSVLDDYRFCREKRTEEDKDFVDAIYNADLLIIDDLGTEAASVVSASNLLDIVNSRITARKLTIISSNMNVRDFAERFSDRLTSRLFGHFKLLYLFCEDIRIANRNEFRENDR